MGMQTGFFMVHNQSEVMPAGMRVETSGHPMGKALIGFHAFLSQAGQESVLQNCEPTAWNIDETPKYSMRCKEKVLATLMGTVDERVTIQPESSQASGMVPVKQEEGQTPILGDQDAQQVPEKIREFPGQSVLSFGWIQDYSNELYADSLLRTKAENEEARPVISNECLVSRDFTGRGEMDSFVAKEFQSSGIPELENLFEGTDKEVNDMEGQAKPLTGPMLAESTIGRVMDDPILLALAQEMRPRMTRVAGSQAGHASLRDAKGLLEKCYAPSGSASVLAAAGKELTDPESCLEPNSLQTGTAPLDLRTINLRAEITDSDLSPVEDTPDEEGKMHSFPVSQKADRTPEILPGQDGAEATRRSFRSEILDQVVEKTVLNMKNGQNTMKIELKPEFLGHLRIRVATENDRVMVRILTEVPLVRDVIEDNLNHLKTALQGHGLQIDEFDVFVSSDPDQYDEEHGHPSFLDPGGGTYEEDDGAAGPEEAKEDCMPAQPQVSGTNLVDYFV